MAEIQGLLLSYTVAFIRSQLSAKTWAALRRSRLSRHWNDNSAPRASEQLERKFGVFLFFFFFFFLLSFPVTAGSHSRTLIIHLYCKQAHLWGPDRSNKISLRFELPQPIYSAVLPSEGAIRRLFRVPNQAEPSS